MSLTEQTKKGYFGGGGGSFVPPQLQEVLDYLAEQFERYKDDEEFIEEYKYYLKEYIGRENPLTFARHLTTKLGGAKIYLVDFFAEFDYWLAWRVSGIRSVDARAHFRLPVRADCLYDRGSMGGSTKSRFFHRAKDCPQRICRVHGFCT